MKALPYISLVIAILAVINEIPYVAKGGNLAWVIFGLAVAVGLNSYKLIKG